MGLQRALSHELATTHLRSDRDTTTFLARSSSGRPTLREGMPLPEARDSALRPPNKGAAPPFGGSSVPRLLFQAGF